MNGSAIRTLCAQAVTESGQDPARFHRYVFSIIGEHCPGCSGVGTLMVSIEELPFACPNCGGNGELPDARVIETVEWIRALHVSLAEKFPNGRALTVEAERQVAIEVWKQKYPRHWWAMESMGQGEFRDSLVAALDNVQKGWMTPKRMDALWRIAGELEQRMMGTLPVKGDKISVAVTILLADYAKDNFGNEVYRVSFQADGWKGRFDTTDAKTVEAIRSRTTDKMLVGGTVSWTSPSLIILGKYVEVRQM